MSLGVRRSARALLRRGFSLAVVTTGVVVGVLVPGPGNPADASSAVGDAGTDTSLPLTDSAVTVSGRDQFGSLRITVNQTTNLSNQTVSITWTGAAPTVQGTGRFDANFLQIFQCWGDPDGTVPANPGPPPEQCVAGAATGDVKAPPSGLYPDAFTTTRIIGQSFWEGYDPSVGYDDLKTGFVWRSFRAVTGESSNVPVNPDWYIKNEPYWQNPFFNRTTTNEIAAAATDAQGQGSELFQVNTGIESTGLGCGQAVQPVLGGGKKIPQCWIVVVPRGTATAEHVGTPFAGAGDSIPVQTSPLSPRVWPNRIAIPISFNPVDSPCDISKEDRRLLGSELAVNAISSWQPALCSTPGTPPYSFGLSSDDIARGLIANPVAGSPGMVVVSKPITPENLDPNKPVVYAPLTASAVVVGFNLEREMSLYTSNPAEIALTGVRIQNINLTPRLLAKLLTQSYPSSVQVGGGDPGYSWLLGAPQDLSRDPDFLQFNREFQYLQVSNSRTFGGLQLPSGASDTAAIVWRYILSDPEAKAWLDGAADPWGMKVNPVYSTNAALNPTGAAFGVPEPNNFPKSDPYCFQRATLPSGLTPPLLCGTDWLPYATGLTSAAQITRVASDGARISVNLTAPSVGSIWGREPPQYLGQRAMLSLTDSASAARFGIQTARLSRPGDNAPGRAFVAPDAAGITAGIASMAPGVEPTVLEPKFDTLTTSAYPLSILTYAAISPLDLSTAARADYAAFVKYAAQAGQVQGQTPGKLPFGYVPLSDALKASALTAAEKITTLQGTGNGSNNGGGSGGGFGAGGSGTDDTLPPDGSQPTTTAVSTSDTSTPDTAPEGEGVSASDQPGTPSSGRGVARFAAIGLLVLLLVSTLIALETSGGSVSAGRLLQRERISRVLQRLRGAP